MRPALLRATFLRNREEKVTFEMRHKTLLSATAIAAMAVFVTVDLHKALISKSRQQKELNAKAAAFSAQIVDLSPYEKQWDESFLQVTPGSDMLTLYETMDLKKIAPFSADEMTIASVTQEEVNGTKLPLYKLCIHNSTEGFIVREPTVTSAIQKAETLAKRPDIRFSALEVSADKNTIKLKMDAVCVLLRA